MYHLYLRSKQTKTKQKEDKGEQVSGARLNSRSQYEKETMADIQQAIADKRFMRSSTFIIDIDLT